MGRKDHFAEFDVATIQERYCLLHVDVRVKAGTHALLFILVFLGLLQAEPATANRLNVGIYQNKPKIYLDENGEAAGYFPSLLNEIASEEGWELTYIPCSWSECLEQLESGSIDLLPDVAWSSARSQRFSFNQEVVLSSWSSVYARRGKHIVSVFDLDGERVAVLRNSIQFDRLREEANKLGIAPIIVEVDDFDSLFSMLEKGEIDAGVLNPFQGAVKQSQYDVRETNLVLFSSRLYFAATRDRHQDILNTLDSYLASWKAEPGSILYQARKAIFTSQQPGLAVLNLTEEELAWLEQHPVIRVALDPDWAPVEFVNDEGEFEGISLDYLDTLSELLNVRFEPAQDMTWQEVVDAVKRHELDMFASVSRTPERDSYLHFTRPYVSMPIKIFTGSDVTYVSNLDALNGRKVAVVENYAIHEWLSEHHPEIKLVPVRSIPEALAMLVDRDVYAFVGNVVTTSYYISQLGMYQVRVAGETPYSNDQSMAVRDDWKVLADILQKTFDTMSPQQHDAIYNRWVSIRYEHKIDYAWLWRILVVASLMLAIILYWNRRLSVEVNVRKQREQELFHARDAADRARQLAEKASQAKSVFVANMSHELRTPLNAILGYSQLLQRDRTLSEAQKDKIRVITRSGGDLLDLINDVLEVSKIEAGRIELNITTFDLFHLLDAINDMFRVKAREKGLVLVVRKTASVPRVLRGDVSKLRQILINLLGNAIKFTDAGKIELVVDASASANLVTLTIQVLDEGAGISPEEQQQIFRPFEQTLTGQRMGGTGLGLAISREYARLMSGDLTVESSIGIGSTFTVQCQLQPGDQQELSETDQDHRVVALAGPRRHETVLVVDDIAENRDFLRDLLESVGFRVVVANNGEQALKVFSEYRPDIILMDMRMPVMNGFEATNHIRNMPAGKEIPIIAVTASALDEQRDKILSAGVDAHLRKPFREEELFAMIKKFLDVDYVFDDQPESVVTASISDGEKPAENPAGYKETIADLKTAVITGDAAGIKTQLRRLADSEPELADELRDLFEEYQYENMIALLEKVENEHG